MCVSVPQSNEVAEGVLVSDEEAFCGAWSMKNQMIMFTEGFRKESGRLYGQIPLQLYSRVRLPFLHHCSCTPG